MDHGGYQYTVAVDCNDVAWFDNRQDALEAWSMQTFDPEHECVKLVCYYEGVLEIKGLA